MTKVYLDHAATTPIEPRVEKVMQPFYSKNFGNASSVHSFGQETDAGVEKARAQAADFLGAQPKEIIFTSGATEGNNTVIKTVPVIQKEKEERNKIIVLAIEHHCVLDSAKYMEKQGYQLEILPINEKGIADTKKLKGLVDERTALVSIMYANNEIGTIQPLKELAKIAHEAGALFHTDAVQAINYIDCKVDDLEVDYLTLSAHKFYGPKGVGLIYKRKEAPLGQFMHGGAQENHFRAGTLNVPGIVGLGAAIELAGKENKERSEHVLKLSHKLWRGIQEKIDDVMLNGSLDNRLPNNLNVTFKYVEGESMLLSLDMEGIAVSTGSACSSGSLEPSHVILALGVPKKFSHGSLRFSFGKDNTEADVKYVLEKLLPIIERLRKMSPVAPSKYHK